MFEVTTAATEQIAAFFSDKEVRPVRIFLNEGGWGGPGLAMALDEPNDADETFEVGDYTYIVNKEFLERAKPIKVDFHMYGFKLDCGIDFSAGAGAGCACSSAQKSKCGC